VESWRSYPSQKKLLDVTLLVTEPFSVNLPVHKVRAEILICASIISPKFESLH